MLKTPCLVTVFALLAGQPAAAAIKSGLPGPVVPDSLGVNIHFTGRQDAQVKKIAEAGFRFVRMDFHWSSIETRKGEYSFKAYDELVESLAEHKIRPLFILDYGNPLYDQGLAPHTDEGREAFARFVEAGVSHFKGKGVIWELWNEPNISQFWQPEPNAENYVKLARAVYKAAKKADPKSLLIAPALACWDFAFLEELFKLGLLDNLDAVSVHPYGSAKPEDAYRYYETVRKLIRKYAPNKTSLQVISGEWGYSAVKGFTVEQQAQFIAREFLVNLANGIPLSIWYDWRDDGTDPDEKEHHFGTVYHDLSEKPAYKAVGVLARELDGFRAGSRIDGSSDEDYLVLFARGENTCLAAWTTGRPHKVKLTVDVEDFTCVSLLGEKSELKASGGRLELEISGSVRYIKPAKPSRRWLVESGWSVDVGQRMGADGLELAISSVIASETPHYEFFAASRRLSAKRITLECAEGSSRAEYAARYVSDGELRGRLNVVARIPQLREPLTRTVWFYNSAAPVIDVAPPSDKQLMIAVSIPENGSGKPFKGSLSVGNYQGIRLIDDSAEVSLKGPLDRQMLKFRMAQTPTAIYTFTLKLVDDAGRDIVRVPARRYSLVETFAGGRPGDTVAAYNIALGGDADVKGEAKLTYAESPEWGPGPVCARLQYKLEAGWKFVQIVPKSAAAIPDRPVGAKIWIKGSKDGSPARLRYRGSDNQTFQATYGRLDSRQWEILGASLNADGVTFWGGSADGTVRYPLTWDSLLIIDKPSSGDACAGEVFIGPIMLSYD